MRKKPILNYDNFSHFLEIELEKNTHQRSGEKKKMAEFLGIHPTLLSQLLNGTRIFTEEQIFLLGEYFGLTELESDYIFLLYQISKTQNKKYKERLLQKRENYKNRALNLSDRVKKDKTLTDEEKSIFYSSWQYSAIRTFSSLKNGKTKNEIGQRFGMDLKKAGEILEFLIKTGLCKMENDRYHHLVNRTHLEKSSPQFKQHFLNWRIKAMQKIDRLEEEDLTFTAPLSLSKKDFFTLREEMVELIKKVSNTVQETTPEEIYCWTFDFFKI